MATYSPGISSLSNKKDIDKLLDSMNPVNSDMQSRVLREDIDKAKRVRETFLGYRKQIQTSLELLSKHAGKEDENANSMQHELTSMLMVLDKLEKRKRITADTLLDFMSQISRVGKNLNTIKEDSSNVTPLAQQLREHKKEIVEDDRKQDKRAQELSDNIGEDLSGFVKKQAELISSGSSSLLKGTLAHLLGPGAPLIALLDQFVDFDKQIDRVVKGTASLAKNTTNGIKTLSAKVVKASVSVGESLYGWFKERWYKEDKANSFSSNIWQQIVQNTKDMKSRLKSISEASGGSIGKLMAGLGLVLAAVLNKLKTTLNPFKLAATLAGLLSPRSIMNHAGSALSLAGRGANGAWNLAKNAGSWISDKIGIKGAGKALGVAGSAYGLYESNNMIRENKGKGFLEGGMNSRAAGYGGSIASGAVAGATIGSIIPVVGTAVGAVIGAVLGGVTALVTDHFDEIKTGFKEGWTKILNMGDEFAAIIKNSTLWKMLSATANAAGVVKNSVVATVKQAGSTVFNYGTELGKKLGFISSDHEGKTNSVTKDNNGSMAYGKYQFNAKAGGLGQFFAANPEYAQQFKGLHPESKEFGDKWKQLSITDPNFEAAQDKAGKQKFYDPAARIAGQLGFRLENQGVREAVFSGSVNHGGINSILTTASKVPGFRDMTGEQQVQEFYKARNDYIDNAGIRGGSQVVTSLHKRYAIELQQTRALAVATEEPDAIAIPPSKQSIPRTNTERDNSGSRGSSSGNSGSSQTIDSVPFMPDDTSLLSLNIVGIIG